jgi:hypothetical protein
MRQINDLLIKLSDGFVLFDWVVSGGAPAVDSITFSFSLIDGILESCF